MELKSIRQIDATENLYKLINCDSDSLILHGKKELIEAGNLIQVELKAIGDVEESK